MTYAGSPYGGTPYAGEGPGSTPAGDVLVATLPAFTGELVGDVVAPPPAGTLDGTLPAFEGSLLAHRAPVAQVVGTDLTYTNDGYDYDGASFAAWAADLATPPWELVDEPDPL